MVDKVFAADCVHKVIKKINTMPQNLKNMVLLPTPAVAVQWSGMRAALQSSSWGGPYRVLEPSLLEAMSLHIIKVVQHFPRINISI